MESKRGEGRKSVIDAISKEDEDVSEILSSLDDMSGKIVEVPVNAKAPQVEEAPYEDKIIEIKNEPENEIIEVKDEPKPENEPSLDNPLEKKYNRSIPTFAATFPIDILEVFMPYYAKTEKYQLDPGVQVLPQLFEACAKNDSDRKLLAELLANGKISGYSSDGKMLLKDKLLEPVIKEASTIIGMMNRFREANGEAMYEILLSELKSIKWDLSTKELEKLIKDCDKLAACAKDFHIDNMNWNWGRFQIYQANETLDKFKREVDNWFEEEYPEKFPDEAENDPEYLKEIKKHLFTAMSVKNSEKLAEMAKSFNNLHKSLVVVKTHNELLPFFEPFFKDIDIDD